ncbi:MAG: hypothetical protein FWF31_04785 [Desulfobulbus sp.]|nr:hypothetical protein [Desulfobulbus sp.]
MVAVISTWSGRLVADKMNGHRITGTATGQDGGARLIGGDFKIPYTADQGQQFSRQRLVQARARLIRSTHPTGLALHFDCRGEVDIQAFKDMTIRSLNDLFHRITSLCDSCSVAVHMRKPEAPPRQGGHRVKPEQKRRPIVSMDRLRTPERHRI